MDMKKMLLGIAVILCGICAILLSGLEGVTSYKNGLYELFGVLFPIVGLVLSIWGFFVKEKKEQ